MSARHIARELAVIVFPQLPKDRSKLEKLELDSLIAKAVAMLCDYAKQSLGDANALLLRSAEELTRIEVEHPDNAQNVDSLTPVKVTSAQLQEQLDLIERAIHLVAEALDIPEMAIQGGSPSMKVTCRRCGHVGEHHPEWHQTTPVKEFLIRLISTYLEHQQEIDEFIRHARSKWKVERMVSIDRDILRLACAEAFFMHDIPVKVSISEAVQLSHRFADEKAARFINGVLADLAHEASQFRQTGRFSDRQASSADNEGAPVASPP